MRMFSTPITIFIFTLIGEKNACILLPFQLRTLWLQDTFCSLHWTVRHILSLRSLWKFPHSNTACIISYWIEGVWYAPMNKPWNKPPVRPTKALTQVCQPDRWPSSLIRVKKMEKICAFVPTWPIWRDKRGPCWHAASIYLPGSNKGGKDVHIYEASEAESSFSWSESGVSEGLLLLLLLSQKKKKKGKTIPCVLGGFINI